MTESKNLICPRCKTPMDECDSPSIVRTYISNEEPPKPLFVLGYYNEKDEFIPDEQPNFRGVSHDLADNETCIECIEHGTDCENILRVDLYPDEGSDGLPNFAYITIKRGFVEQVIQAHRELVLSSLDAGVISTSLALQLSNSKQLADVEHDHFIFCESEHIVNIETECRISKAGAIVVTVLASAAQAEFCGDTAPFKVASLFDFEATDFIAI